MAGSTIRKALGAVKDQTSISIAKVSSAIAPELDVAVVKATSHEDEPANEKYMREIISLTTFNRPNLSACVTAVSRRLNKTRDWIVAVKTLILVHRLLVDGDRGFHEEILYATRRGTRILNMSDFKDEAHSASWDHSSFVKAYALYLDQSLECALFQQKQKSGTGGRDDPYERERGSSYYSDGDYGREARDRDRRRDDRDKKPEISIREMKIEAVLEKIRQLQKVMDRFLACRPVGRAKNSRMILVAVYPIVRENFQLYADICEVLAVLADQFPNLDYDNSRKAFDAYAIAAKQINELLGFYGWCKDIGIARSSEYPEVKRISDRLLDTLEEMMRDKAGIAKTPYIEPKTEIKDEVVVDEEEDEATLTDMGDIKALPAPEDFEPKFPEVQTTVQVKKSPTAPTPPLVDLREDTMTADEQGNKLALSLFSGTGASTTGKSTAITNGAWEAFPSDQPAESEVTSAWQNPAAEAGKADWELALVETAGNLEKQKALMAGGFDNLLLDGMYEQGAVRQHVASKNDGGSSSSVALPLPGGGKSQVLALPAPDGTVKTIGNEDPFMASLSVPAPSYVQMAEIEKKQQLVVQEQLMWQQYERNGMQGQPQQIPPYGMQMGYGMQPLYGGYYYTGQPPY